MTAETSPPEALPPEHAPAPPPVPAPASEPVFTVSIPADRLIRSLTSSDFGDFQAAWGTVENNPDDPLVEQAALMVLGIRRVHNGDDHRYLVPVLHALGKRTKPLGAQLLMLVSPCVSGGSEPVRAAAVTLLEKQRVDSGHVWPDVASTFCDGKGGVVIAACQACVALCPPGDEMALTGLLVRAYYRGVDGLDRGDDVRIAAVNGLVLLIDRVAKQTPRNETVLQVVMAALKQVAYYGYTCPNDGVRGACREGLAEMVRVTTVPVALRS